MDSDGCFIGDCSDTIRLDLNVPTQAGKPRGDQDEFLEFNPDPATEVPLRTLKNVSESI